MIVEQVHLIHIQQAAVGLGQQARLKGPNPLTERFFDVDRAAQAIFRGPQGEIHHGHLAFLGGELLSLLVPEAHLAALEVGVRGGAVVGVAGHHVDLGEQVGEGSNRGGFARAPVSHDHHPANARIDHVEQKGQLHLLLPHDGSEREDSALAGLSHGRITGEGSDCFTGSRLSTCGGVASAG